MTYRVRYRDPSGASRSKSFVKKADAERYAATVEADKARGLYIDPSLGRMTLGEYADQWLMTQTFDESTREATALRIKLHINPVLGLHPLVSLRTSHIQSWLRGMSQTHAPRTVRVIFSNLSSILSAAVDDERISKNPCQAGSIRLPKLVDHKIIPWTVDEFERLREKLPERFRVAAVLAAGCGLRQGEVFGLAVEDVDFLRGVVHVRRQVRIVGNRQAFAPPKGGKLRDVPLPQSVAEVLAEHLRVFPAVSVTLPWRSSGGADTTARLILSTRERTALNRNYINSSVWKPALRAAGLSDGRENGMHALRHLYASVLLDGGTGLPALAEYLGHSDPGFTLRVYTHLMPAAEDRTKKAVDDMLGRVQTAVDRPSSVPDVSRTAL